MDYMKEDRLIDCGLTRNESRVYLALLKLHNASAIEITKQSGVHRINVYDVLERLRLKGLVSELQMGKRVVYGAADPGQLMNLVKEKEQLVREVVPILQKEFAQKKEKHQVYQFFGPEGVMQAYFMMLEQKAMIYGIGGSGLNRVYLKHRHELWNRERLRLGISGKLLYYEFTRKDNEKSWHDSTMETRYIPNAFKTVGMIDICGDMIINLLPLEGEVMAIVVENKTLAETYKQLFRFMWQFAKR